MWKDVQLESDEVAVIWGQTADQASAGLFRPATYRVVSVSDCLTKHMCTVTTQAKTLVASMCANLIAALLLTWLIHLVRLTISLWCSILVCSHKKCSTLVCSHRMHILLQVGELYSSCHGNQVHAGRQSLAFHLNARPSAVLNFHDILQNAGHFVSDRWGQHAVSPSKH